MQNHSLTLSVPMLSETHYSGPTVTFHPGIWDSFSFSGFGPNPDPLKIEPVPGSFSKVQRSHYSGNYESISTWNGDVYAFYRESGFIGSFGNWCQWYYPEHDARAYNECLSKLYDEVKATQTNIALTIGEWRETSKLAKVSLTLNGLIGVARDAKRMVRRNPSILLSKAWLSYKYAWMPLLFDLHAYAEWGYRIFDTMSFKARRRITTPVNDAYLRDGWATSRVVGRRFSQVEIGVTCAVEDPEWFTLSRITSMNPASIAWELMPLSFVVDWVYDVSSYLQNLESALLNGLVFKHGYVTKVAGIELSETIAGSSVRNNGGGDITNLYIYATCKNTSITKERVKLSAFPLPQLPTLELRLGWQRVLSAAALFRVVLLGGVR